MGSVKEKKKKKKNRSEGKQLKGVDHDKINVNKVQTLKKKKSTKTLISKTLVGIGTRTDNIEELSRSKKKKKKKNIAKDHDDGCDRTKSINASTKNSSNKTSKKVKSDDATTQKEQSEVHQRGEG